MNNTLLKLTDTSFPLSIIEHSKCIAGPLFQAHLHEHHMQIFYFTEGNTTLYVNQTKYEIHSPDLLLINTNELHYGENKTSSLHYFVFRINLELLCSYNIAPCTTKYFLPLKQNIIQFHHHLALENIQNLLDHIITECHLKQQGYELNILSHTFNLLCELLRYHLKQTYSLQNAEILMKRTKRFTRIFEYINTHYAQPISLDEICKMAHMSQGYFCRMFKQSTGKSLTDYINRMRIEKSVALLNQGVCNVTEAALSVGFDDVNYFSRVFKKYMKQSPRHYLKNDARYFL